MQEVRQPNRVRDTVAIFRPTVAGAFIFSASTLARCAAHSSRGRDAMELAIP
jgi:hypothetical protein